VDLIIRLKSETYFKLMKEDGLCQLR